MKQHSPESAIRKRPLSLPLLTVAALAFSAIGASAQYNVTDLSTNGAGSSIWATGSVPSNTIQAGTIQVGVKSHAAAWSGTSASLLDLNPPLYTASSVQAIFNNTYAGSGVSVSPGLGTVALVWTSSSPASAISLAPIINGTRSTNSVATGTLGFETVGYAADSSGNNFAYLWQGTNPNGTNLNPSGYSSSEALAIAPGAVVGYAQVAGGNVHAMYWFGRPGDAFPDDTARRRVGAAQLRRWHG